MNLFKRGSPEITPVAETFSPPIQEFETEASEEFDPNKFVADHSVQLESSRNAWVDIAKNAGELMQSKTKSVIREGLPEIYEASDIEYNDDILESDTDRVCRDLSVYTLLTARQLSGENINFSEGIKFGTNMLKTYNPNLGFLIGRNKLTRVSFGARIMSMAHQMQDADRVAKDVLTALASGYADRPEGLVDLAGIYNDGAAHVNPHFAELKEMIAQDWHSRDPRKSILKTFLADITAEPRAFVDGFSAYVERSKQDKRIALVKSFADFAIAASEGFFG